MVRKNIKTSNLVLKRKKLGKPQETSRILGKAVHSKRNKHVSGFPLDRPNQRRAAAFMECGQLKEVLPLKS
jgi:hypothetical protein